MDGLARLRQAIRDTSDPAVVMRRVLDQAMTLIPAAGGAVIELVDGDRLVYVCGAGTMAEHVGVRLALAGSLSGLAVCSGETLRSNDTTCDARVDAQACLRVGVGSMVCVPLRRGDTPIGVLKVSSATAGAFSDTDVATLARLAEFMSVAVDASAALARVAGELMVEERDLAPGSEEVPVRAVGAFVANVLAPGVVSDLQARERVTRVLAGDGLRMVCQPIVHAITGELVGAEALARFSGSPARPPDVWFREAEAAGLGIPLQLAAATRALRCLPELPPNVFLAINVGPEAIAAPDLLALLRNGEAERIVLELTEHLQIDDYPQLRRTLGELRDLGARLAIDDTGAGFSSLAHIVNLAPDLIKLDRQLTRGIDLDPVRRAVATALLSFASETGAQVIAEGVETADELETVRTLGIEFVQGYFTGRPAPASELTARVAAT